jgi:hypothetical protein
MLPERRLHDEYWLSRRCRFIPTTLSHIIWLISSSSIIQWERVGLDKLFPYLPRLADLAPFLRIWVSLIRTAFISIIIDPSEQLPQCENISLRSGCLLETFHSLGQKLHSHANWVIFPGVIKLLVLEWFIHPEYYTVSTHVLDVIEREHIDRPGLEGEVPFNHNPRPKSQ